MLELDSVGCILFEYTAYNLIVGDNAKVYVICQQYDAESVYFYEDCCYMYASDGESELQVLKDKNDWDKPLDYSKNGPTGSKRIFTSYGRKYNNAGMRPDLGRSKVSML